MKRLLFVTFFCIEVSSLAIPNLESLESRRGVKLHVDTNWDSSPSSSTASSTSLQPNNSSSSNVLADSDNEIDKAFDNSPISEADKEKIEREEKSRLNNAYTYIKNNKLVGIIVAYCFKTS